MPRPYRAPGAHALGLAAVIDTLLSYADGARPRGELARRAVARLEEIDPDRNISRRIARNFGRVSHRQRVRAFGKFDPGRFRAVALVQEHGLFQIPPKEGAVVFLKEDDVGDPVRPTYPEGTEFTILYTGLYCNDSSGDRFLVGPSDETYVITSVVSIENGQNVIRQTMHPVGDPDQHYDDVDDGETRNGPVAAVWQGPQRDSEISVITVVMEHDEGKPNAYAEEIAAVLEVIVILGGWNPAALATQAIVALAALALNWVLDSDDDMLGTDVTVLSREQLGYYGQAPLSSLVETREIFTPLFPFGYQVEEVTDETGLEYHFAARTSDGARYVTTYKVTASNPPLPPEDGRRPTAPRTGPAVLVG